MLSVNLLPSTDTLIYSYINSLILKQLFQSEGIAKISELTNVLTDHYLSPSTLKSFLVSNTKRFTYLDRYWIPTTRVSLKGLSAQRIVKAIVENLSAPISISILAQEISRMSATNLEASLTIVRRLAIHDPEFFLTEKEEIGLGKWVFRAQHEPLEQALKANQINIKHFDFYKEALSEVDWNSKHIFNEITTILSEIDLKTLGAVAWDKLNYSDSHQIKSFDWKTFYASLLSVENWIYCEGFLFPKSKTIEWTTKAPIIAEHLKSEIVLESAHLDVKSVDIEKMILKILSSSHTITVKQLLEEFFEIFPSMSNYTKDSETLVQYLIKQTEIQWLGGDRFQSLIEIPDHVQTIPELFHFEESSFKNESGELIDFEISDEGLSSSLLSIMNHPLAVDVLDTDQYTPPSVSINTYRFVLKAIHREIGTFPLCQFPTHWISMDPKLQEVIFIDPEGKQINTWVNTKVGLFFDLIDWWYEQPIESGAVFTLTKTQQSNVFHFRWEDLTDPIVYISNQKMEMLRSIDPTDKSTFELLCNLFQHWQKGVDFLTLLWEINIVRRSKRRLIASILNSYECFYQRSGSSLWFFESKKVNLGINKGEKRFILK